MPIKIIILLRKMYCTNSSLCVYPLCLTDLYSGVQKQSTCSDMRKTGKLAKAKRDWS